uniref:Major facilitator superfamily (MFS) profile domain-containing protein n=1 Tax=Sinocyclocheilus grahami TaxID=75366 RepID=A0A672K1N9_SINGR
KKIILFANVFEMVGNFMHFMRYSKWLLLCSHLVAGIGTGAGSSIFGFLTRNTAPEDRSTVFAAVMACRQAGLLIGPAFNLFLRLCNFQIRPFTVNKYTSTGLFMCLLWILLQFVVLFMYWDFTPQDETLSLFLLSEFLREEVVVLLAAQFITLFNQTALEVNMRVIAGFLFVRWLSKRVAERVVLAVGLILCNISCVWCLIFLLAEFIIGVFLQVLGLPFVAVAQVSLFSKITSEKTQGYLYLEIMTFSDNSLSFLQFFFLTIFSFFYHRLLFTPF